MGYGSWSNSTYADYSKSVGRTVTNINGINYVDGDYWLEARMRSMMSAMSAIEMTPSPFTSAAGRFSMELDRWVRQP